MVEKNNLAPITLYVYDRPWHTEQTLDALSKNKWINESILYVFADGPKRMIGQEELEKIKNVRKLINKIDWCKKLILIERDQNFGLANSILSGVTEVVKKHGKIIVLEDDLVTSPGFLDYMNQALIVYEEEQSVMHISGYTLPVKKALPNSFFYNVTSCWGWGTWNRAWNSYNGDAKYLFDEISKRNDLALFDLDSSYPFSGDLMRNIEGKIDTWAVKWYASVFLEKGFCLHPGKSFVRNIGHDGSGVHCNYSSLFYEQELANFFNIEKLTIEEHQQARKMFQDFYDSQTSRSFKERLKAIIRNLYDCKSIR